MATKLIGLGSKARIGKDYAAKQLADWCGSVERIAFADALKQDVAYLFGQHKLDYWSIEQEPELKEKIRPLLVEYGCTMRKFNENIWVDRALKGKNFTKDITLITDVRFPNEANRIKELGGYYIEIQTDLPPANETEAHYSPLMAGLADFTIKNNFDSNFVGDLIELIGNLERVDQRLWKKTQSKESSFIHSTEGVTGSVTWTQKA